MTDKYDWGVVAYFFLKFPIIPIAQLSHIDYNYLMVNSISREDYNESIFLDVHMLMMEADLILEVGDRKTKGQSFKEALEHFNTDLSVMGEVIDEEILSSIVGNSQRARNVVLHTIVPHIGKIYNSRNNKGRKSNNINHFFEQLGYEDNKYYLANLQSEFGLSIGVVSTYTNDMYQNERGIPTKSKGYMWRKKPKK